jgi:pyruvate,water dikinase
MHQSTQTYLQIIDASNVDQYVDHGVHLGTKAENLFKLQAAGFPVPPFFCVPHTYFQNPERAETISERDDMPMGDVCGERERDDVPMGAVHRERERNDVPMGAIHRERMPDDVPMGDARRERDEVPMESVCGARNDVPMGDVCGEDGYPAELMHRITALSSGALLAVRSSASAEDGSAYSFAGQFESYMDIAPQDVPAAMRRCHNARRSARVAAYCKQTGIGSDIIEMNVIVQRMAQSERSGVIFTANPAGLLSEMVIALGYGKGIGIVADQVPTVTYYCNLTDRVSYYEHTEGAPLLTDTELDSLICMGCRIRALFDQEMDIEFTLAKGEIAILQARPITGLRTAPLIVMDSSNIVESYPGLTLPFTFDFVREAYRGVFRDAARRIVGDTKPLKRAEPIFKNMIGIVNGRVYYRISNWYGLLTLLPFRKKLIPLWQDMMGVKIKQVDRAEVRHAPRISIFFRAIRQFFRIPKEMATLKTEFQKIERLFETRYKPGMSIPELFDLYRILADSLLCKWGITLLNDLYAFVWTGVVRALLKRSGIADAESLANEYISGIERIESMKPVRAMAALATRIAHEGRTTKLEALRDNGDAQAFMAGGDALGAEMAAYIQRYGDRYLAELKLESPTFRSDPILLVKRLIEYSRDPLRLSKIHSAQSHSLPHRRIPRRYRALVRHAAKRAQIGIQNREVSRLDRSRIYGMIRNLSLSAGEKLAREGYIENPSDIFYLHPKEVLRAKSDLTQLIQRRKARYQTFALLPAYTRLVFAGKIFDKSHARVMQQEAGDAGGMVGTPCSSGIAEGTVLIVHNPKDAGDVTGRILVTQTTDPGWVFLLVQAAGIIAERGSLLSHTAIIAREMGIPSIVGVPGATRKLHNGQRIRIDCSDGSITPYETLDHLETPNEHAGKA